MVEHFHAATAAQDRRPRQGHGGDRLAPGGGAVQAESFDRYIKEKGYAIKTWWPSQA
jgi:hypothetical protein